MVLATGMAICVLPILKLKFLQKSSTSHLHLHAHGDHHLRGDQRGIFHGFEPERYFGF